MDVLHNIYFKPHFKAVEIRCKWTNNSVEMACQVQHHRVYVWLIWTPVVVALSSMWAALREHVLIAVVHTQKKCTYCNKSFPIAWMAGWRCALTSSHLSKVKAIIMRRYEKIVIKVKNECKCDLGSVITIWSFNPQLQSVTSQNNLFQIIESPPIIFGVWSKKVCVLLRS